MFFLDLEVKKLVDGLGIFQRFFTHQVKVLIAYKKLAEKKEMASDDPACTAEAFESLAYKYFPFLDRTSPLKGCSLNNFYWPMTGYSMSARGVRFMMTSRSHKCAR
jgi:hypothetical protein